MEFKRVFGPPGCGKTTWLAEQARLASMKFDADRVVISSFTRAAAAEIASRNTGVPRQNVGTLHSLCFRAMGNPELAESHVKEWNSVCGPNYQLDYMDAADPYSTGGARNGDKMMRMYQLLRAKLQPENQYPKDVLHFAQKWDDWKASNSFVDFTDLIDFGRRELDCAPGMPKALFVDEAQDLNPMQLELIEKWAVNTEWTIMVGDPDQSIYSFAGADPYSFVNAPSDQKFHPASLKRSWRLPRAVHAWSVDWIRQIKNRDDVVFEPRDAEGEVEELDTFCTWREPEGILEVVKRYVDQGKKVGVLATCGYMLDPLKKELRAEGLPFHNPWRTTRGDWNPLSKVGDRVGVFLRPCREVWGGQSDTWTGPMLVRWADSVSVEGVFKRGAKARITRELKDVARPIYTELLELFVPGVFEELMNRMEQGVGPACEWLMLHAINDQMRERLAYPVKCVLKSPTALFDEPKICIGTGHSVKGADKLDVVILMPDLSMEGDKQWRDREQRESIIRLIYVMATRARETLLLGRASGDYAVWN